jgi:hypothetical protein
MQQARRLDGEGKSGRPEEEQNGIDATENRSEL